MKNSDGKSKFILFRIVWFIIGTVSLALGVTGVVLPILPTTPFLLITAFAYAKSSKRFHDMFIRSKLYRKHIKNFVMHKSMSVAGEIILLSLVSAMLITTMYFVNNAIVSVVLCLLMIIKYTYFVINVIPRNREEMRSLCLDAISDLKTSQDTDNIEGGGETNA